MAAKGSIAKTEITNKILETFEGSFLVDGKEIRIPWNEGSEVVQIKVALTCAKVNIENAGGASTVQQTTSVPAPEDRKITETEKQEVNNLIEKLGL